MGIMVIDKTDEGAIKFNDIESGVTFKCGSSVFVKCSPMRAFDFTANEMQQIKHNPAVIPVRAQLKLYALEEPTKSAKDEDFDLC
jgi:hypothetical protein